ncbi:MAG: cation transporter, partial [Lentisphaerae bacterium]|nr:cation transporter [Lentisphaerota bacterium]
MAVGIPLYVCATASVPIAAALIAKGVSPGAAFVFLVTGPATNVAAVTTMWKVLGRRTTLLYLGTVAVMALLSGMILDALFTFSWAAQGHAGHFMLPGWVGSVGGVVLLAVLGTAFLPHRHAHDDHAEHGDAETAPATTFHVGGMRCSQCARSVRVALGECPGVESVDVDLDRGEATVTGREFDVERLAAGVISLGYTFDGRS